MYNVIKKLPSYLNLLDEYEFFNLVQKAATHVDNTGELFNSFKDDREQATMFLVMFFMPLAEITKKVLDKLSEINLSDEKYKYPNRIKIYQILCIHIEVILHGEELKELFKKE